LSTPVTWLMWSVPFSVVPSCQARSDWLGGAMRAERAIRVAAGPHQ
jgi:hypothetical protein